MPVNVPKSTQYEQLLIPLVLEAPVVHFRHVGVMKPAYHGNNLVLKG
jgi:hypothetical protein